MVRIRFLCLGKKAKSDSGSPVTKRSCRVKVFVLSMCFFLCSLTARSVNPARSMVRLAILHQSKKRKVGAQWKVKWTLLLLVFLLCTHANFPRARNDSADFIFTSNISPRPSIAEISSAQILSHARSAERALVFVARGKKDIGLATDFPNKEARTR